MAKKQIDLGLTGLDELFMDDKERAESKLPKIYEIPLSEIDEFPNHPFHVRLDEDMDQLVESIKERGIITPVTLRQKPDGRYEIVSGHRRTKACELAGKLARIAEVGTTLEAMQRTVGGNIEAYYPFEEQVCIVCNDEGKINGLPLNRAIRDEETHEIVDAIAGTFFICDCSGESFGSLSKEQQKRYLEKYRLPERFFRTRNGIESVQYKPQNRER